MKTQVSLLLAMMILAAAVLVGGCSSEKPQTAQLYTDAKVLWDDFNRAFTLPKGQERVDMMRKIIDEKWDIQIVSKLEQYLREAPNGRYAKQAKALLDQAKASTNIQVIGQARPLLSQTGLPKTAAGADSLAMRMQQARSDTAAKPTEDAKSGPK